MTGRSTPATGGVTDDPIRIGTMLYTLVEPHRGHQVAYNRWYERDHFYAGCQIGAYNFAGARFVATAALKALRYPEPAGPTPWSPIRRSAATSASTTCSTATTTSGTGGRSTRSTRSTPPVGCSTSATTSTPASTASSGSTVGTRTGCRPSSPSTTGSRAWSRSSSSRPTGWPPSRVGDWYRDAVPALGAARLAGGHRAGLHPRCPCWPTPPATCPASERSTERLLLLCFLDEEPAGSWDAVFAGQGEAVAEAGLGRVHVGLAVHRHRARHRHLHRPAVVGSRCLDDRLHRRRSTERTARPGLGRRAHPVGARSSAGPRPPPTRCWPTRTPASELTFAGYRDACLRAAAGLSADVRGGPGHRVSWELPTWNESLVLVGALARLGARQNPLIPIYRGREVGLHHRPERGLPAGRAHRLPRASTSRPWPTRSPPTGPACRCWWSTANCPTATPADLPAVRAAARARAADAPIRWLFYTSGTTADPKGARTPTSR